MFRRTVMGILSIMRIFIYKVKFRYYNLRTVYAWWSIMNDSLGKLYFLCFSTPGETLLHYKGFFIAFNIGRGYGYA